MSLRATAGVIAIVCVAGLSGSASAAPASSGTADREAPAAPVGASVRLTADNMKKLGETVIARIEVGQTTVRKMVEKARTDRDVVKTLCLNDKLTQFDVTLRSARERKQALDVGLGRGDTEMAAHEVSILEVYRTRADRLTAEANQCIGSDVGFVGASVVTSSIDPGIPNDTGEGAGGDFGFSPFASLPPGLCDGCAWTQPLTPVSPTQATP